MKTNFFRLCVSFALLAALESCIGDDPVAVALRGDKRLNEGDPVPFLLYQNDPNPFNPSTQIRFEVPTTLHLQLRVYSEDWQEVAVLVNGVHLPGLYAVEFNALYLASGVYYYVMEGGGVTQIRAMRLVK